MTKVEEEPQVWVVACGDEPRRTTVFEVFQDQAICAIGPAGDPGDPSSSLTDSERGMLRRFISEVRSGDLVILRGSTREVLDIGKVGEPHYRPNSGIASWDLAHQRDVTWLHASDDLRAELEAALSDRDRRFPWMRFSMLAWDLDELRQQVRRGAGELEVPEPRRVEALEPLSRERFSKAVRSSPGAQGAKIDEAALQAILEEASEFGTDSYVRLEADTVAMVVVPLLTAIGVPHRNIRVEVPVSELGGHDDNGRIDVVVFADHSTKNPLLLIEAKRRWHGLDGARNQVERYASALPNTDSLGLMITDGAEFAFRLRGDPKGARWRALSLQWPTERGAKNLAAVVGELAMTE